MKKTALFITGILFYLTLPAQFSGFEASLVMQQMNGDYSYFETESGKEKFEVDNFFGYGFQAGMLFNKLNMSLDFIFGTSEILSANRFEVKISCVDIDFEYSFLNKPLTPLLVAGIGSVTFSDSFTSVEELNETDFSYNFAAGVKWVIAKKIFIKPLYRTTFTKIKYSENSLLFNGFSLSIGYMFPVNF